MPPTVAITAVFRDESPFLREWVEYHRVVGVTKFFLFDNNFDPEESQASAAALAPRIRDGSVEITPFHPKKELQLECYTSALPRAFGFDWLGAFDIDEFLVPVKDGTVNDALRGFDRPDIGGLAVCWRVFGTSNLVKRPKCQIESLVRCAPPGHRVNTVIKVLVRPERAVNLGSSKAKLLPGFRMVDTAGHEIPDRAGEPTPVSHLPAPVHLYLQLNHYTIRTEEDWEKKIRRGWTQDYEEDRKWSDVTWRKKYAKQNRNEVEDRTIHRFLAATKAGTTET